MDIHERLDSNPFGDECRYCGHDLSACTCLREDDELPANLSAHLGAGVWCMKCGKPSHQCECAAPETEDPAERAANSVHLAVADFCVEILKADDVNRCLRLVALLSECERALGAMTSAALQRAGTRC